jgi:hypothetical protein
MGSVLFRMNDLLAAINISKKDISDVLGVDYSVLVKDMSMPYKWPRLVKSISIVTDASPRWILHGRGSYWCIRYAIKKIYVCWS